MANQLDTNTIGVYNVQCVMDALACQETKITEDELLEQFTATTDASRDDIENELKRILQCGVDCGFIVKTGNEYAIPKLENLYEPDCDESKDDDSEKDNDESKPGPSRIDVKVELGPSTRSGSTRKRRTSAGPSSHDHCSKRVKKEPICEEAADLMFRIDNFDWASFEVKRKKRSKKIEKLKAKKFKRRLFLIKEDSDDEEFGIRPPFRMDEPCVEDDTEDDVLEDEAREKPLAKPKKYERRDDTDDDDDDEGPSACPTVSGSRRSTRKRTPATGKCGGLSHSHKCAY